MEYGQAGHQSHEDTMINLLKLVLRFIVVLFFHFFMNKEIFSDLSTMLGKFSLTVSRFL